jgi:hypothetical protein
VTGVSAPRRAAALLVASAAVLLTAACGGGSTPSSGTPAPGAPNDGGGGAAFTAYTDCLKKNGVTITMPSREPGARPSRSGYPGGGRPSGVPRPSGSAGFRGGGFGNFKPEGVDDATWQKAQAACASLRPSGRPGGPGNGGGANAAYRNCLKDHGVTAGGTLNTADPATAKAIETCKVLAPQPSATPAS